MKQILFFIESLNFGGAEKSFLSLVNHLDPHKYNIDVLVIKGNGDLEKNLPQYVNYSSLDPSYSYGARAKYMFYRKFHPKRHNAQYFWKAFKDDFEVYTKEYDLAIAWGQGFATYYVAEKIKALRKCAWINIDYDKAGYVFRYDRGIYSRFDFINGVSPFVNEVMVKYVSENKLIHIPNIIDRDDVLKKSLEKCSIHLQEDKFNIVSLGRLAEQKAFYLCLQAAAILKANNVNFQWYIVGDGSERANLVNLRKELNIENEIVFTGFQHNPYCIVKQADLYVQTSIFEGLGRTLIEAAMLHKPIVTTDFETAFDLVEEGKTGFITKKEPNAIANAILNLYQDKQLLQEMTVNLKCSSRISAQKVVEQFDEVVSQLLSSDF